ncbi:hypothetical protein EIP86_010115 [Pleurotus ostreatoroseus]|nr:hypothetical protein EIP86_010115 [Pleurotus ostreatoroseus]
MYTELVHQDAVWTIDDVASVVGYFDPRREKDSVDKFLEDIFRYGGLYKKAILTREQAKRNKEVGEKFKQAVVDVLGERRETMIHLGIVCTAPEKQGHGARADLSSLDQADAEERATWLISSNALNEGFYNSLGFETAKEIVLGDDNPTWNEPPVVIALDTILLQDVVPRTFAAPSTVMRAHVLIFNGSGNALLTATPPKTAANLKACTSARRTSSVPLPGATAGCAATIAPNTMLHADGLDFYCKPDVLAAADTNLAAFKNDPLHKYMTETPDSHDTIVHHASRKARFAANFVLAVNKGTALTIDDGAAVVTYSLAKGNEPSWSVSELLETAIPYLFYYNKFLMSKEQEKRWQEFKDKARKLIEEYLGNRKDSMMSINIACTAPEKQGHGYGSKLIKVILATADEEKRSVWLISINKANEGFYEHLGFKTVKEEPVGDGNPMWTEPPIMIGLVRMRFDA